MVMHARKTQRMSDGYFEKHPTHPYQNSKYGSSKNYGSSSERYEKIRTSPNGNYRSDSPDSQSPRDRDRAYQSKNSYIQKMREKERENRDYKSRDKYSDCARSPKDRRNRDSEHRTNHDRSDEKSSTKSSQNPTLRDRKPVHNCIDKREDRDRITRVGDWSEHISSSGKKYYYNCKTEVSQWEKPREWVERERFRNRDRDRESDRSYSSSSRSGTYSTYRYRHFLTPVETKGQRNGHDKHSNSRGSSSSMTKEGSRDCGVSNRHWGGAGTRDEIDSSNRDSRGIRKYSDDNSQTMQDMDISPGDSTPTSEISYAQTSTTEQSVGPVLLAAALPRLVSHPLQLPNIPVGGRAEASPQSTPSMVPPPSNTIICNAPGPPPPVGTALPRLMSQNSLSSDGSDVKTPTNAHAHSALLMTRDGVHAQPLAVDTNHNGPLGEGPPTPTHSEILDCAKVTVPVVSPPSGSLSSLQGVSSSLQALRPQGPSITPSLANHYRDDLVNHVRGWPAEILEKQSEKLAQEAHIMGAIQCAKVSAELKSARSIVRLTEIQATLQEQRILFLRHQIKALEEMKSQNSFMSDDS